MTSISAGHIQSLGQQVSFEQKIRHTNNLMFLLWGLFSISPMLQALRSPLMVDWTCKISPINQSTTDATCISIATGDLK